MNIGLYQAVSGMKANQQYQEMLASNLATQNVAGNRGTIANFAVNMPDTSKISSKSLNQIKDHPFVKMNATLDTRQGPLRETSNPFNLAIEGNAFFKIKEADGRTTLTRNGQFLRSPEDELVTLDGAKVMMDGDQSLKFSTKGDPIISQGGEVKMNGEIVGKIAMVTVPDEKNNLKMSPSGRYTTSAETADVDKFSTNNKVMQGYVEDSNINPVEQMVNMMQVTRLYEAGQKMIEAHDQSTQKLIQATSPK